MKYIKNVLDNGMTIIMIPQTNTHMISFGFFIKAGSRNETNDNSGIAHFLEHMMFKGTNNRTAEMLFNELDIIGASYNAATTAQNTYYYIYGNSDDTEKILDIVLDIYINPVFKEKEIINERKVVVEEMRLRADNPMINLYSKMHKKIFEGTSLARDIIGTYDTVMNLKKKDLVNFRLSLYKPINTVFVVCGNFDPDPIYKIIEKNIVPLKNMPNVPSIYFHEKQIIFKNMASQKQPYIKLKRNNKFQQMYVLLAFPMYDLFFYKDDEINLLTKLLISGFSSRLSRALRENHGITYKSSASPLVYSDSGIYLVQMILNPIELVKGLKILFNELKRVKEELMTENEMEKIINVSKNDILFSFINPVEILIYFGLNFISDRTFQPEINKKLLDLNKITRSQIQKVAKEIFIYEKINLFIYGNSEEKNYDFNFINL